MEAYRQRPRELVEELLRAYIRENTLKPGDKLPSERELCRMWSVNRSTLRSAMSALEIAGMIHIRPGSGAFLSQPKFTRNLQDLCSLSDTAVGQGRVLRASLLSIDLVECDKSLARHFNQMLGYKVYKLVRLRSLDIGPLLLETAFIPAEYTEGLPEKDLEGRSLFSVLEEYSLIPERGEESISITYAMPEEVELLEVPEETPLFWIVSSTYDKSGILMEYCRTVARTDRLRLASVLHRCEPEREGGHYDEI